MSRCSTPEPDDSSVTWPCRRPGRSPSTCTATASRAPVTASCAVVGTRTRQVLLDRPADGTAIALSADGERVAVEGQTSIEVFDVASGQPVGPLVRPGSAASNLALSPGGTRVAAIEGGGVALLDDLSPSSALTGAAPRSAQPIVGAGVVRLWDAATGAAVAVPGAQVTGATGVAFSPVGDRLAVATSSSGTIVDRLRDRGAHTVPGVRAGFAPDGTLVTVWADGTVTRFDPTTGRERGAAGDDRVGRVRSGSRGVRPRSSSPRAARSRSGTRPARTGSRHRCSACPAPRCSGSAPDGRRIGAPGRPSACSRHADARRPGRRDRRHRDRADDRRRPRGGTVSPRSPRGAPGSWRSAAGRRLHALPAARVAPRRRRSRRPAPRSCGSPRESRSSPDGKILADRDVDGDPADAEHAGGDRRLAHREVGRRSDPRVGSVQADQLVFSPDGRRLLALSSGSVPTLVDLDVVTASCRRPRGARPGLGRRRTRRTGDSVAFALSDRVSSTTPRPSRSSASRGRSPASSRSPSRSRPNGSQLAVGAAAGRPPGPCASSTWRHARRWAAPTRAGSSPPPRSSTTRRTLLAAGPGRRPALDPRS